MNWNFETSSKAIAVGGTVIMPVEDFPWGTRSGILVDPFGYRWSIGNESGEVPPPEKIAELAAAWEPVLPEN